MIRHALLSLAIAVGSVASARAVVPTPVPALQNDIVTVSGGCGPYAFRGPYGGCRPIRQSYRPRPCPPGFHLGPYAGRCIPNR